MSCSAHCAVSFRRIHGRSRSHGHCRSNAGLAEIDQVTGVVVRGSRLPGSTPVLRLRESAWADRTGAKSRIGLTTRQSGRLATTRSTWLGRYLFWNVSPGISLRTTRP
jgi:hypothetical protein